MGSVTVFHNNAKGSCHLHPLQAANCCRNSRHVVDEDVPAEKTSTLAESARPGR